MAAPNDAKKAGAHSSACIEEQSTYVRTCQDATFRAVSRSRTQDQQFHFTLSLGHSLQSASAVAFAGRVMPGTIWRSGSLYDVFAWQCDDPGAAAKAREKMAELAAKVARGKSAILWDTLVWGPKGFTVRWKQPVTHAAGHAWFYRQFGKLVADGSNKTSWSLRGVPGPDVPTEAFSGRAASAGPLVAGPSEVGPSAVAPLAGPSAAGPSAAESLVGPSAAGPSALGPSAAEPLAGPSAAGPSAAGPSAVKPIGTTAGPSAGATVSSPRRLSAKLEAQAFPKCPALKLAQGRALGAELYTLTNRRLGGGAFGAVFAGTKKSSGDELAIKVLNHGTSREDAWAEAYVLDRCRGHPNIVTLLDVYEGSGNDKRYHFVFEMWGLDLAVVLRGGWPPRWGAGGARTLSADMVSGVSHLHALDLVHADLKPANILVRDDGAGLRAKVADLGWASLAEPSQRRLATQHEIATHGLQVQTLLWRAPEALLGDSRFGVALDAWSLGLVVAEVAGERFHRECLGSKTYSQIGQIMALLHQLGTPTSTSLTTLPLWLQHAPSFRRKPWHTRMRDLLGAPGVDFVDRLLTWCPQTRMTVIASQDHAFLNHTRFELGGRACPSGLGAGVSSGPQEAWKGERHDWRCLTGNVGADVLRWLRGDEAFDPSSEEFAALKVRFHGACGKNAKHEGGCKYILAGHLGLSCASATMCTLSLDAPLPFPRLQAWFQAFRYVNKEVVTAMAVQAIEASRRLPENLRQHANVRQFCETLVSEWFLTCGEVFFVRVPAPSDGDAEDPDFVFDEAPHVDGAASIMHMGITLFGRRMLRCEQGASLPDVIVNNVPGHVYMGGLTGPLHQVRHQRAFDGELLALGSDEHVAVAIMARCALFSYCRSRCKRVTPAPHAFFEVLATAFREGLRARWVLPTLEQCVPFYAAVPAGQAVAAAVPSGRGLKRRGPPL